MNNNYQNNMINPLSNGNQTNMGYQSNTGNQANMGYHSNTGNQANMGYQSNTGNQANMGYQSSTGNQANMGYHSNIGSQIIYNNTYNDNGGQVQQQVIIVGEAVPDKRTTKNLAITSLVVGITGFLLVWTTFVGIIWGIVGTIQAIISLAQHRPGKGIAIAGLIINIIICIISILFTFFFIAML